MVQIGDIVRGIVAAAGEAGRLVRFQRIHHRRMNVLFFKSASATVALQALGVLESAGDGYRVRWRAHVLLIEAGEARELVFHRPINCVVGMAGVTGRLYRHAVVLKMLSGKMTGIICVETLSVWLHGVAGE